MKKLGMKLFKAMNWAMVIVCMASACLVDSASWIPTFVCAVSLAYLGCALYICEAINSRKEH